MRDRLELARFSGFVGSFTWQETVHDPADLRVGCELPFWGQKFEFTAKPRNLRDEEIRLNTHHGQQWLLYDTRSTDILRGWTLRIEPVAGGVRYTCLCAGDQHDVERYTTRPTATNDIPTTLADILDTNVEVVPTVDQANNFDANATTIGAWRQDQWDEEGNGPADDGIFPDDAIEELLEMADGSNNIYDYWTAPQPADFLYPLKDHAYYRKRDATAEPTWLLSRDDLAPGGVELSSDIFEVANTVKVRYGWLSGSHDGSSNVTDLADSGTTFADEGVQVGDRIFNLTDGSQGVVDNVNGTTIEAVLEGGTDDDWDTNDEYAIRLSKQVEATATATANYWDRLIIEDAPGLTKTQAGQLASLLLERYNNPFLRQSFTVTAPEIRHKSGAMRPLWHMLIEPATIIIEDLEATAVTFDNFLDNKNSFFPTRIDYDYERNRLTVTPGDSSNLDTMLARSGVSPGGMVISAGGRP